MTTDLIVAARSRLIPWLSEVQLTEHVSERPITNAHESRMIAERALDLEQPFIWAESVSLHVESAEALAAAKSAVENLTERDRGTLFGSFLAAITPALEAPFTTIAITNARVTAVSDASSELQLALESDSDTEVSEELT